MATRLLLLVAAVCAGATAAPAAAAPISSAAQLFTCCTPEALQARMFSEAEASGAEYVRVDVELHGIFGAADSDPPDWTHLDRTIALARAHRVKVLGLIRGTPGWLSTCREKPKASICPPRDPARWGELAGEVAAHARGEIDHWEILNEPDARWAFLGSAEDYARMLSAAYGAIKQQAPEAQVVFGGVERPARARLDRACARHPRGRRRAEVRRRGRAPAPAPAQHPARAARMADRVARAARPPRLPRADLGDRARLSGRPRLPMGSRLSRH